MKTTLPSCRIARVRNRVGRCYELALLGQLQAPEWTLIHGECAGPPGTGRIGHAWLEKDGTIYDPVMDKLFSSCDYVSKFQAVPLVGFAHVEAARIVATAGHYGPWSAEEQHGLLNH